MVATIEPKIRRHSHSDGQITHYRHWGVARGRDAILMLHGAMSHSAWQAPLAEAVVAKADVAFIASDRRGAGLNEEGRGDAELGDRMIDDVVELVRHLRCDFDRVHLAGWCLGGQLASVAAARLTAEQEIATLALLAPAFFFGERYGDVLRRSTESVLEVVKDLAVQLPPTRAYIPIPLRPDDFTTAVKWQKFIASDPLRTTKVTQRALSAGRALAERAVNDFPATAGLRVLAVLGTQDRLVDNAKVAAFLKARVAGDALTIDTTDAGHAVQFEQPQWLAQRVISFISGAASAEHEGS